MNPENLSLIVAFGAGVLSFASPCVLPLVPAYIGHLAGRTLDKEGASRAATLAHAVAFVLGFSAVFVTLGASVGLIGYVFQDVIKSLAFRRLNRHAHAVELTSGGLMVVRGVMVALNVMTWIAAYASRLGFTGV